MHLISRRKLSGCSGLVKMLVKFQEHLVFGKRSNREEDKLSVDEIKVRLRQETELNIINGVGISFFSSGTTAVL